MFPLLSTLCYIINSRCYHQCVLELSTAVLVHNLYFELKGYEKHRALVFLTEVNFVKRCENT